jgi:nitrite reductase/ring-hydroxylating ferredoxin subunit
VSQLNRRHFLLGATAGLASACGGLCGCGTSATSSTASPLATFGLVDAGPVSSYQRQGIYDAFVQSHGFFLVRTDGKLYASSASCTHKRFRLELEGQQIVCDKHGSLFDAAGKPIKGPATRPLPRFAIALDERKHIMVDGSRTFEPEKWADVNSFVSII